MDGISIICVEISDATIRLPRREMELQEDLSWPDSAPLASFQPPFVSFKATRKEEEARMRRNGMRAGNGTLFSDVFRLTIRTLSVLSRMNETVGSKV